MIIIIECSNFTFVPEDDPMNESFVSIKPSSSNDSFVSIRESYSNKSKSGASDSFVSIPFSDSFVSIEGSFEDKSSKYQLLNESDFLVKGFNRNDFQDVDFGNNNLNQKQEPKSNSKSFCYYSGEFKPVNDDLDLSRRSNDSNSSIDSLNKARLDISRSNVGKPYDSFEYSPKVLNDSFERSSKVLNDSLLGDFESMNLNYSIPIVSKDQKPTYEPQWLKDMKYGVAEDDPRRAKGYTGHMDYGFRQRDEPINMYKPEGGKAYNTYDKSTFGPSVPIKPEVPRYISDSGFDICREYFLKICEDNNIKSIKGSCDTFARPIGGITGKDNRELRISWLKDELMHWHGEFDKLHEKSIEVFFIYDGKLRKYVLNLNSVPMNDNEIKKYVNEIRKYEDNLNKLISQKFIHLFTNYLKELMEFTITKKEVIKQHKMSHMTQTTGNAQKLTNMKSEFTNGMQELSKSVINNAEILHNELMIELGLNSLNYKNM